MAYNTRKIHGQEVGAICAECCAELRAERDRLQAALDEAGVVLGAVICAGTLAPGEEMASPPEHAAMDAALRLRSERDRLERERKEWAIALQSLTPGGSEFQDPEACVAYVQDFKHSKMKLAFKAIKRAKALAAENAGLRGTIRWALGEEGEFRMPVVGEGRFWWRTELRQRASEPSPLTAAVQRVLETYAPALGLLLSFKYFCENQKDECCNDPGAECPIAMGEWWEKEEVETFERAKEAHDHLQALLEGRGGR